MELRSPSLPWDQDEELASYDDVVAHVGRHSFAAVAPGVVGVELEWLVVDVARPERRVSFPLVRDVLGALQPLPGRSTVTYEPGGQVELSSAPAADVVRCVVALRADLALVGAALADQGLALSGVGADPVRPPVRVVDSPRYAAMEAYFAPSWPAGRTMMCSTASVQVNLEAGEAGQQESRWNLAHLLGPVLVAAFANSPLLAGRPTGWRSTRQAVWAGIDPSRTRPAGEFPSTDGPVEAWARYAADAQVMLMRERDGCRPVTEPLSFAAWMAAGRGGCRPTGADLAYHLTTLFPPVRPRGWLELRMIDAQSSEHWPVAAAVTTALLDDPVAADIARAACAPTADRWRSAARDGLADPALAAAARSCFAAAVDALPRLGAGELVADVAAYAERFVEVGRCPADDLLLRGTGAEPATALFAAGRTGRSSYLERV